MKKGRIAKTSLLAVPVLVVLIASLSPVVNASSFSKENKSSTVETENSTSRKIKSREKKSKFENLSDEEKEALKAEMKAKREEKKAKYENLTEEEKEALKVKRSAKKVGRKNNKVTESEN